MTIADLAALSPLARRLAETIAAEPRQRVSLELLYSASVAFDRGLATAPGARAEIRAALDELVGADMIIFPGARNHFDMRALPPLPNWVRRPPRVSAPHSRPAARVWPPVLEAAGRIATRDDEIAVLEKVAAFLRDRVTRPSVPARERSLQLFDDEKRLDALRSTRLFTSGALTLDLLRCHNVPIPFVSQWVPGADDPQGVALLVAENHHTYTSLLAASRRQAALGGIGRYVGYGTGGQFASAVASVSLLSPVPRRICYFGDVDLRGLQIPTQAHEVAQALGLPAVRPALSLYRLLFEKRHARPAIAVSVDTAAEVSAWLGPYATDAASLLVAGLRLPQEAVGLELLLRQLAALDSV